jgi:hypothetical protein
VRKRTTLIEGLAVLLLGALVVTAFAATRPYYKTVFADINLSNTSTNKSVAVLMADIQNPTFYFWNKENGTTAINVSIMGSFDGANWSTLNIHDNSNGSLTANPVTCKVMTANATQVFWPIRNIMVPWMKVTVLSNVSNATNTTNVNCYMAGME